METNVPVDRYSGSWTCTSPSGEVREFYDCSNAELAAQNGWLVETTYQYLCRINAATKNEGK